MKTSLCAVLPKRFSKVCRREILTIACAETMEIS